MTQETKQITLRVRQVGDKDLKKIVGGLDRVDRSTRRISSNLSGLRNIFFTIFGGLGIRELANAADSVQLLNDRIKVFTGSSAEADSALTDLFAAADLTNTSVDSLAETFNRVALATKELGLNTDELIGFTATLQNTFRLSGASIAESAGAAVQLTQGLASGQLRGQELRSVLEANAVIGQILADTLGTTRGQLIKFAESGQITSDVLINALSKSALKLNDDASKLGQTFGQTLTKAFNSVKIVINDLNKKFKLNENFAKGVDFLVKRMGDLAIVIGVTLIPTILNGLKAIGLAVAANPITLLIASLAAVVTFGDEILFALTKATLAIEQFFAKATVSASKFLLEIGKSDNAILKALFGGDGSAKNINKTIDEANSFIESNQKQIDKLTASQEALEKKTAGKDLLAAFKNLGQINLPKTIVSVADSIKILNRQLAQGQIGINKYRESLNKIRSKDLEKRFEEGTISAIEFRNQLIQINDLNDKFSEKVFTGFTLAAANYADEIGTITSQLQSAFESTFNKLEDVIFDSLKKGKFLFSDFAQFVLDELTRVAIRTAIISPFANAFASTISGGFGGDVSPNFAGGDISAGISSVAAKGQVYSGGRQVAFAKGGILDNPTFFPLSSGMGLAGEAGSEAVVPLTRTSNGDLGVKANPSNVVVNVNNSSGSEVDVKSSQVGSDNVLDITITKAVGRAIASGQLDRSLQSNFGLNRKGTR